MRMLMMAVLAVSAVGCATGFRGIYPGMNGQEVAEAMGGRGPAEIRSYDQGYASWYYDEDRCVLMKDNLVVAKDVSHDAGGVHVIGVGGFSLKDRAQCVPPGLMADPNQSVSVGFGPANVRVR